MPSTEPPPSMAALRVAAPVALAAFSPDAEPLPTPASALAAAWIPGHVAYPAALAAMEQVQGQRRANEIGDTVAYLEHEAVVTYGRGTPPGHLGWTSQGTIPAISVPRGGLATYHGPGQLVGYLFLDLGRRHDSRPPDLHAYLRALEQGLITFLKAEFDLEATTRAGYTGVWTHGYTVPSPGELPRKVAAIGVSVRRWVTAHGFALNIDPDLSAFKRIVPCGITDAETTSVAKELELGGREPNIPPMKFLAATVHAHIAQALQAAGWCLADGIAASQQEASA